MFPKGMSVLHGKQCKQWSIFRPKGDVHITQQTMGQFNENDDWCMAQRMVPQSHQFLMYEMAEKHKGMFGKVVKNSISKLFPRQTKGTVISPRSKTTEHNNANSVSAQTAGNNYDGWVIEWMTKKVNVFSPTQSPNGSI